MRFKKLFLSIMLMSLGALFMNDALAYTNEVRQSGSSYIWRVNNVDQGSTNNLAQAIMNCMGTNRDIDILVSGTITQTISITATDIRLWCHGNTLTCNFDGVGISNNGRNGFEIHDLTLRNITQYGIRCSGASDLSFTNVSVIDAGWIGMRIDSRSSNPWNYTIYNLYMRDIHVENCGSHGLETYSIDGIDIDGTVTARNCGDCGVLFNQSRNGSVENVDAYNCCWGGGYAGLRYANGCNNITTNYLRADRCGRGFFIVQSGPTVNCHLNNAEIYECSGLGIWIENGTNCSVKAGCCQSAVSVSGSGSYANVSSSCSGSSSSSSSGTNGTLNGTYSFIAVHSGKALDTYNWGTGNGTNIVQWSYWGGDPQRFVVTPVDGIWHRISPVISSGQAFDIYNISTANGANLNTWSWWGGDQQQFRFQSAGTGRWRIIARHSEKCIDIEGVSTADGANALQWACVSGAENQMFESIKHSSANDQELLGEGINIFPNPNNGRFSIDLSTLENGNDINLEIVSADGKRIYRKENLQPSILNIEIDLEKGIYIVMIQSGNNLTTRKLTIK